jgi:hypothetical protein
LSRATWLETNSQATSIDHVENQPSRIAVNVSDVCKEPENLLSVRTVPQCCGSGCPERVYVAELLLEHIAVEKEDRVERLVLRAG